MSDEQQGATPETQQGVTPETPQETASGATPQTPNPDAKQAGSDAKQAGSDDLAALRKELESANARIKELNKENEKRRKAAEEAEKATLAEQGKFKELFEGSQAELEKLRSELAAKEHSLLVNQAAQKHNLPPELAARLRGNTAEELEADAKELAKFAQPKREAPPSEAARNGSANGAMTDIETKAAQWGFSSRAAQVLRR